jgi:hypothetical protein
MRLKELEKKLTKWGWNLNRHGRRHDIWTKDEYAIAVPRHNEINEYSAKAILKEAKGDS